MAQFAGLCEPARHVIRIRRVLEVGQVTRNAGCRRDVVIVVHVAIRTLAWRNRVRSRQREVHGRVVETGGLPGSGRMACLASLWEVAGHMVRVRCTLKILQMAPDARGAVQRVVVIDVTIGALARWHRMHAGQSKSRRGMVKLAVAPLHGVMALLAGRGKTCVCDRGGGASEIFLVTGETLSGGEVVVIVHVAVDTLPGRHRVAAGQRKPDRGVVELRVQPVVRQVAGCTVGGEMRSDVIRIRAALEICGVTGKALCRHRLKLTLGCAFVASVACDGRVGSCQRKAVIMLLDLLHRNLPSADCVALLAIRS